LTGSVYRQFDPAQVAVPGGALGSRLALQNNGVLLKNLEEAPLRKPVNSFVLLGMLAFFGAMTFVGEARAAGRLNDYIGKAEPADLVPGANRFGPLQGDPAIAPAYKDNQPLGFVYLNSDFANAIGYSGKPIQLLIGIDPKGVITGLKLVEHKEPIVLVGIPEKRILEAVNKLIGTDMDRVVRGAASAPQVDIVSGATVTVLVMGDSIVRSATKLIRSGRLGAQGDVAAGAAPPPSKAIDPGKSEIRDWQSLVGDGSVRRLILTVADVNGAFEKSGNAAAAAHPEEGDPDDSFIDLHVADVAVPTIGRSLLGDDGYNRLMGRLKPGQQALIVAGSGRYSFKGAAYVRGGIFDRIELIQDTNSTRFRDRDHTRLGSLAAEGAPDFPEIALFTVPAEFALDPTEPWLLRLLVQRVVGTREKAWLTFDLSYALADAYMKREPARPQPAASVAPSSATPATASRDAASRAAEDEPLWIKIWRGDVVKIGTVLAALSALTAIFFFQNALVRRPKIYVWVRRAYLFFILVWLGWYANAQLSVVNVLTFANSLLTGFSWEYFLSAPLIFLLWASIAAGLLFWGRGPFCGWLCPFGALQELLNNIAQAVKIPQYRLPWGLHERLWPIKYIIFLGLFGMSLYSTAFAEQLAEVEPFKTAIVLKFAREWPFVIYALTTLSAGLFVERFFCRYMCPLGAALAIPGRIRMFEWLRRWPECGTPCQRCAKECPVQAIHPEGHINVNECIYCMHCQELYFDDHRCPHMIQVRLKREKRDALSSPSMRSGKGPNTIITAGGRPIDLPRVGATPPAT
jgi:NosR/NirI family nitrous oxide reductase transcriptional regulator